MPKILVGGASGKLAGFIISEIIGVFGMDALVISDYQPERLQMRQYELQRKYGKAPGTALVDVTSVASIRQGIASADYIVVPISQSRPLVQEACILEGKVCIDLGVSASLIEEALNLETKAADGNALLVMAAGLFPGLSGILAKAIHANDPDAIVDIGLIQSKDGVAGGTGIADMLQLFNQDVDLITPSGNRVQKGFNYSRSFRLDSRFGTKQLRLANFIERNYLQKRLNIKSNYWSAFDAESFNKLIAFLRMVRFLGLFEHPKYRLKLANVISKNKQEAEEEVIGIIGQTDAENRVYISLASDYAATASCVAAYIKLLQHREQQECGVFFPFELFELEEVLPHIEHKRGW